MAELGSHLPGNYYDLIVLVALIWDVDPLYFIVNNDGSVVAQFETC